MDEIDQEILERQTVYPFGSEKQIKLDDYKEGYEKLLGISQSEINAMRVAKRMEYTGNKPNREEIEMIAKIYDIKAQEKIPEQDYRFERMERVFNDVISLEYELCSEKMLMQFSPNQEYNKSLDSKNLDEINNEQYYEELHQYLEKQAKDGVQKIMDKNYVFEILNEKEKEEYKTVKEKADKCALSTVTRIIKKEKILEMVEKISEQHTLRPGLENSKTNSEIGDSSKLGTDFSDLANDTNSIMEAGIEDDAFLPGDEEPKEINLEFVTSPGLERARAVARELYTENINQQLCNFDVSIRNMYENEEKVTQKMKEEFRNPEFLSQIDVEIDEDEELDIIIEEEIKEITDLYVQTQMLDIEDEIRDREEYKQYVENEEIAVQVNIPEQNIDEEKDVMEGMETLKENNTAQEIEQTAEDLINSKRKNRKKEKGITI